MVRVYAVGVGPGSPACITRAVEEIISRCDIVAGYEYTLGTIRHLLKEKEVVVITMSNQEKAYQEILSRPRGNNQTLVVPFTGDVSFSEAEVVDRLIEIFGDVTIVPGISSVQEAAARTAVALDRSRVVTLHVTSPIGEKKIEVAKAVLDGLDVVLIPRPWPGIPPRHFMPSEVSVYLREMGVDTSRLRVHVFEAITTDEETHFEGTADELVGREFSPLSIMVFAQSGRDSYMNYRWQWEKSREG